MITHHQHLAVCLIVRLIPLDQESQNISEKHQQQKIVKVLMIPHHQHLAGFSKAALYRGSPKI